MNPERHRRVGEVFLAACELDTQARAAFVERECGSDVGLRAEVERMLASDGDPHAGLLGPDPSGGRRGAVMSVARALEPDADSPPDSPPDSIGPFRIVRRIGAGGMGVVYEAQQEHPARRVALKIVRPQFSTPAILRRFENEANALARLQHPGIAQIFESGLAETPYGSQPYFAMELVEGREIGEWVRARRPDPATVLELVAQVADAIQQAHERGIVHRDLKSANILVDDEGRPKVLDFGVARVAGPEVDTAATLTREGQVIGTLGAMSPEQASGAGKVDARSDLYSLGVLLYELLCGRAPLQLEGLSLTRSVALIREHEPMPLGQVDRRFAGDVETIVAKAMEKEPERRYACAADFARDLRRHLREEPIEARPPSRLYLVRKFVRRNRTGVLAGGAVVAALVVGLVAAVGFGLREAGLRRLAEAEAYRGNLTIVRDALRESNGGAVRALHAAAPKELRNWEWHHLQARLDPELARAAVPDLWGAAYRTADSVVTVDGACRVALWRPIADEVSAVRQVGEGDRLPLRLTKDGRWLVSWSPGALHVGDPLGEGPEIRVTFPHGIPVANGSATAVSADRARLAVATDEGLYVVDLEQEPSIERVPEPPSTAVHSIAFSPDGSVLAAGCAKQLLLYETADLQRIARRGKGYRRALEFDGDGRLYVNADDGIEILESSTGRHVGGWGTNDLRTHDLGSPVRLDLSPDGGHVLATFPRGPVWTLGTDAGELVQAVHHGAGAPVGFAASRAAFGPDGRTFLTFGGPGGALQLWRTAHEGPARVLRGHTSYVYPVAISPDGARIASGAWNREVRLWDAITGEELAVHATPGRVYDLAFDPDGDRLACAHDRGVLVWGVASGEVLHDERARNALSVSYAPAGDGLAVGYGSGAVRLLDPEGFAERGVLQAKGEIRGLAHLPRGHLLAVGSVANGVSLWDPRTFAPRIPPNAARGVHSLAVSADGTHLAAARGNRVTLHSLPDMEPLAELVDHQQLAMTVAFSPDGTRLASGGRDGFLRIWSTETHQLLLKLAGHEDYVYSLEFTPDGTRIVTGSGDGTVRIWDSVSPAERWKQERHAVQAALVRTR